MSSLEKDNKELEGIAESSYDYMRHTRPEVRSGDWVSFNNRYASAGECCAIETLMSSVDMDGEMEAEQLRRLSPKLKKEKSHGLREPQWKLGHEMAGSKYLERVRINSTYVLACLAKVTGDLLVRKASYLFEAIQVTSSLPRADAARIHATASGTSSMDPIHD